MPEAATDVVGLTQVPLSRWAWAPAAAQTSRPREELLPSAGASRHEVDRMQAHQHQHEILRQNFARWVVLFSLVLCTMLPTMTVLFIWLLVSVFKVVGDLCLR
ncbi:unnamed protein product [Polarella glacialis]|uniref:Uncharacterized protein n=1 Tax=Polarella glacialis TaxID=89957 RepID=A0A813DCC5_POLGL|nr:unnamed protein product [Polarella glacialis]